MGHAVEPLVDRAGKLPVAVDADLGQRLEPHLQLPELSVAGGNLVLPPAHMHHEDDGQDDERKDGEARKRKQNDYGIERDAPHLQGLKGHGKNI